MPTFNCAGQEWKGEEEDQATRQSWPAAAAAGDIYYSGFSSPADLSSYAAVGFRWKERGSEMDNLGIGFPKKEAKWDTMDSSQSLQQGQLRQGHRLASGRRRLTNVVAARFAEPPGSSFHPKTVERHSSVSLLLLLLARVPTDSVGSKRTAAQHQIRCYAIPYLSSSGRWKSLSTITTTTARDSSVCQLLLLLMAVKYTRNNKMEEAVATDLCRNDG